MIDRWEIRLRNLRRMASRSEWSVRRLGRPLSEQTESQAGLVLVHLQGLLLAEIQEALEQRRLPFLKHLLDTEGYELLPLADCESHTPVEREARLLYGQNGQTHGRCSALRDQSSAIQLDELLRREGSGLLEGGSQYGGTLSGGASECHFCAVQPDWGSIFSTSSRWRRVWVLLVYGSCFVRSAVRAAFESLRAVGRWIARRNPGTSLADEIKQAIGRVRESVLHRHLAVAGAGIDAARGLPVIHVNLNGSCRQVERSVRSIWHSARRSARRDYDVWIYSSQQTDAGSASGTAVAIVPGDAPLASVDGTGTTLNHLREAALHLLGRGPLSAAARPMVASPRTTMRVMTYNVHSCLGMDGKLSPARIARIIARCGPDIVALQELDVGRARTGAIDQAEAIARELKMEFHFHPALALEEELYGDAILSRYPMRLRRAAALPGLNGRAVEPRGALWVTLDVDGREVQLLNTHLGLVGAERLRQVEALLTDAWLAHADCRGPTILCGDFNALPRSAVCRRLTERLADAQCSLNGHRPRHTFFARYPIGRIDHVFVSREFEVVTVEVPRNDLTRRASDHLPLVVELRLP